MSKTETVTNIEQEVFPVSEELWIALDDPEEMESEHAELMEPLSAIALQSRASRGAEHILIQLGHMHLRLESELAALEAKYKPIQEMIDADLGFVRKQLERCKNAVLRVLEPEDGSEGITNDKIDIYLRPTESCEIFREDDVPIELCRVVTEPDKKAIKEAILSGQTVPGARVNRNFHPTIKPGGARAIANAKKREKSRAKRAIEKLKELDSESEAATNSEQ